MLWRYRFVPGRFGWELPGGIVEKGEEGAALLHERQRKRPAIVQPSRCVTC